MKNYKTYPVSFQSNPTKAGNPGSGESEQVFTTPAPLVLDIFRQTCKNVVDPHIGSTKIRFRLAEQAFSTQSDLDYEQMFY